MPLTIRLASLRRVVVLAGALLLAACTITPPTPGLLILPPSSSVTLDQYQISVAHRIVERNPARILHGSPQAMLRSLVVVAFTVDRRGQVVKSAVYRSNGDDEAERIALATLRHAAPLPPPPARLLDRHGEVDMMESWLFNDDGQFQLRSIASPQAQTLN